MEKWDKTTRQAWEKSIVAQEFEKHILGLAAKLKLINQASINDKAKEIKTSLTDAEKSLNSLLQSSGETSLADDSEEVVDITSEDEAIKAQAALIGELNNILKIATDMGNIKLAYRIERTISELSGE